MAQELRETRLPGVGTKFTFTTDHGSRVAVIQHLDGSRELYVFRHAGYEEATAVLQLEDDESRQLGAVLGGAYERPKIVESSRWRSRHFAIEWVLVPSGVRRRENPRGVRLPRTHRDLIIAILREPERAGAQPDDVIADGTRRHRRQARAIRVPPTPGQGPGPWPLLLRV
jgi:K+/H+ antiporter YhaU regulatory subunit KhtT